MDIKSKEFRKKFSFLFEKGYCARCISIMIFSYSIDSLCPRCNEIFNLENKNGKY